MSSTPAYGIRSLAHAFDGHAVLDIPRLEIRRGEICALVGPNGSGKTTLLSILALLLTPLAGTVHLDGVESTPGSVQRRLRRQVTLIHQKPVLFSTTVWNNVSYGLRASGLPGNEIKTRVGTLLEELGLSAVAWKHAHKLSGGESQRAILARGLVLETPILLLDEPTSFLDSTFRPLLFDMLARANQARGTTIMVATHDLELASSLAHRFIRLEEGRIMSQE